jgi:hypothetical protein
MEAEINGEAMNEFAIMGDGTLPLPSAKYISVRVYADGKLIRTVTTLDKVNRIKSVLAKEWEVQVNGTAEVDQITMATTVRELNEV